MDGLFINGTRRPRSKKEVREAVAAGDVYILVENTSMHGGQSGPLTQLLEHGPIHFVGPDPYRDRRFYGTITKTAKGVKVS